MCRFLSHQGTEYTLSGLFSAASADSSEHISLANGREINLIFGCGLGHAVDSAGSSDRRERA